MPIAIVNTISLPILSERIPRTIGISILAIALQWIIGIPIGIYSGLKKNSIQDYLFSFIGFIGLAIPPFMLAIVSVYYIFVFCICTINKKQ